MKLDPDRFVGYESRKAYRRRCESGFWERFIQGPNVIDIGYRGGVHGTLPIVEGAIGVEADTPGYDGLHLNVEDGWADAVHSSHLVEHLEKPEEHVREWFRALRIGGHLILFVPHAHLYERRLTVPPSRWSPEHLRSYVPSSLLTEIEQSLLPNSYRVRHLADNDDGYDYALPMDAHPVGGLEIELVLQKIARPSWNVEP